LAKKFLCQRSQRAFLSTDPDAAKKPNEFKEDAALCPRRYPNQRVVALSSASFGGGRKAASAARRISTSIVIG